MSDGKGGIWSGDTLVSVLDSLGQTYVQSAAIENLADPQYVQAQAGVQQQVQQTQAPMIDNKMLLIGGAALLSIVVLVAVTK